METIEIVGIVSAFLTLAAFVGNEYGKLSAESIVYDVLNFIASIGLLLYAAHLGALPFMVVNTVWALVSGFDVVKYFWGIKKV
jgi:formate hydrogenlyase subunit 3/multisubunit Na+/H+ antiporter MnhD subunit